MIKLHWYLIACAFFFVILAESTQAQSQNEIEVRGTLSIPSGEANFSGTTNSGSTINFSRDFDFGNEFGYELRYQHISSNRKHKFLVDYAHTDWERSTTLTRSITFRGETFTASAALHGELSLRTFRAMYAYRWGNEKFRFGPMGDMGVVSTKLELSGITNNGQRTGEATKNKFAATLGYDLDYDPNPHFNFSHNLGVIAFKKDRLFHIEGGVKYFPVRSFGVSGGYKFQRYKFDDDPDFLTIRSNGPYFGGVLRF